jgi:hypothetical protein
MFLSVVFLLFMQNSAQAFQASWEVPPQNSTWSVFMYQLIDQNLFKDLDQARDIIRFCPAYSSLPRQQKIYTWIELFSQVAYYESGWDPTSRMKENMGIDPVTGGPVHSEGLLQLSYQDVKNYGSTLKYPLCRIHWALDLGLHEKDSRKTIFDPFINLECGSRIMAAQIVKFGNIVMHKNVYWSTLREGGRYSVVPKIEKAISSLQFCR